MGLALLFDVHCSLLWHDGAKGLALDAFHMQCDQDGRGWGKGGVSFSIHCAEYMFIGQVHSEKVQYIVNNMEKYK